MKIVQILETLKLLKVAFAICSFSKILFRSVLQDIIRKRTERNIFTGIRNSQGTDHELFKRQMYFSGQSVSLMCVCMQILPYINLYSFLPHFHSLHSLLLLFCQNRWQIFFSKTVFYLWYFIHSVFSILITHYLLTV